MRTVRRAVIDVGTNSVKLLVADVSGSTVQPVEERSEQTRLGRGFYTTHCLQPEAINHTAQAVAQFAELAVQWQAVTTRVIATSAARDACNQDVLKDAIQHAAHLSMEIISGDQEAEWAFKGVMTDPLLAQRSLLVLDVGGGSTQTIFHPGAGPLLRHSFRMGAVRLQEHLKPSDPPRPEELAACQAWIKDYLHQHVRPFFTTAGASSLLSSAQLVGTGGTSSLLAAMHMELCVFDRARIDATALSAAQVRARLERLWTLSLAERKQIVGLPPQRADVILTGVAIYEGIMNHFGFKNLRVSTRGVRFAALME